jgi:hypothetical protein
MPVTSKTAVYTLQTCDIIKINLLRSRQSYQLLQIDVSPLSVCCIFTAVWCCILCHYVVSHGVDSLTQERRVKTYIYCWLANIEAIKIMQRAGRDPSVNQRWWNSTRRRKFLTYVFVMKCRNAEMGPFACFIRCFDLRSEFMRNKRPHTFICTRSRRQQSGGIFLIKNFILRECPSLSLSHWRPCAVDIKRRLLLQISN